MWGADDDAGPAADDEADDDAGDWMMIIKTHFAEISKSLLN